MCRTGPILALGVVCDEYPSSYQLDFKPPSRLLAHSTADSQGNSEAQEYQSGHGEPVEQFHLVARGYLKGFSGGRRGDGLPGKLGWQRNLRTAGEMGAAKTAMGFSEPRPSDSDWAGIQGETRPNARR
jgi:hypothetical protein